MSISFGEPQIEEPEVAAGQAQDQILALWGMVLAGTLGYREFITLAAEVVTTANLTAWQLADITTVAAVLAGSGIDAVPIGYDAPAWLRDPKRVERQIAKMLDSAMSAEVRTLHEQERAHEAMAAQDELRARKLLRLVDNETATSYASSEGVAILTLGQNRLVHGWIRRLGVPKVYAARTGHHRGGSSAVPCGWCITLNGGNAVRPWYYAMGRHDADRCRKQPVTVPLSEIGHLWRDSFERSNQGLLDANRLVDSGRFGVTYEQPPAAA